MQSVKGRLRQTKAEVGAPSGGVSRRVPYIERPNISSQASIPLSSSGQVQEELLFLQSKKVDVPMYIS